jgi:integrase
MGLGAAHRNNAAIAGASITDARDLAAKSRLQLQHGLDPIDERSKLRDDAKQAATAAKAEQTLQALTLARAARDYHERVIEPSRTDKHGAQWISSLENHVPAELWHAPIASITAPALLDFLIGLRKKVPETAMRIRQRLETVFEDAIFRGVCNTNPAAATKRKLRESASRHEKCQFAALPFADAPAFLKLVRAAEGIAPRCLEFAALTVSRTMEAIGAEWSEFDVDQAIWTIPAERMKAGEPHIDIVYLSPRALELLEGQRGLNARWVFPTPTLKDKPLSNMAMLTLLDRMEARQLTTVHGLCRATFSTWAYETNVARPEVIEACLAHRESDKVKAAYNRAQFAVERRALLLAWADYLSGEAKAATPSNVVALRAA